MAQDTLFTIRDLRGGVNNSDSPTLLKDNEVVEARNVDFRDGALGSKRNGTEGVDMTGALFNAPIVAMFRFTPTDDISDDELWAIDSGGRIDRRVAGVWQGGVARANDNVDVAANNYDANAVSLHGKLFISALGSQDRLLVWDQAVLRWAGIAQCLVPTVTDTGAGSFTGTRYYRIRYVEITGGGRILRRSEPSESVTFSPSGAGSAARITKPVGTELATSVRAEGQTHWEVEASTDNVLFYRIATVLIGTAFYDDTTAFSTGYAANTLSENIGEYVPPGCAHTVGVDEDRLLVAGNRLTDANAATVWWTPVGGDDGVGNDERIPTATKQYITFDGLDGGGVRSMVAGAAGNVYVFKRSRIYKMVRTGVVTSAYFPVTESGAHGSTRLGATAGLDEEGAPCIYFIDPAHGLCRIARHGVESLARPVRDTWKQRNLFATVDPRIVYYPELEQVWYAVALNGSNVPNELFVYETQYGANLFHGGLPATAQALVMFPDVISETLKPFMGGVSTALPAGGTTYIHECDSGDTDTGEYFRGYVKTKPYQLGNLWQRFGLMAAIMLARAATATTITLNMIRNFGIESRPVTTSLTPADAETHVVRPVDNATMSELNTIQIEYGDAEAGDQAWSLDQLVLRIREEERSA